MRVSPGDGKSILQALISNDKIVTLVGPFIISVVFKTSMGVFSKSIFFVSLIDWMKERKKATIKVAFLM